jgi:beta-aspartyl-peptidase (threonine type)
VGCWSLVIHGGAGLIQRRRLRPEQERAYRASLSNAIAAGAGLLSAGGAALDCVEAVICVLEDDPLFNAGRGAVFTADGHIELDASIMDGRTLSAGAVTGVTRTRHPISLARRVLQESVHVMLGGPGVNAYSKLAGLEQVGPEWFHPHEPLAHREDKFGTVGAAALDHFGNVAAGTSSGGTSGKRAGRIGDSPLIGAGTYASNVSCAVSATGSGEHLIRIAAAHEVCALVEHKQMRLQAALDAVIRRRLAALGAAGGLIAVAPDGQIAWSFNTPGMYRARFGSDQPLQVGLYCDDT